MLEIKSYEVYGLEEAVIDSGLPMSLQEPKYNENRAIKLGSVPSGTGHDNFLKGIVVRAKIKYPLYWTKQFQRYHFADIISSQSTMHRITKMNMESQCNEYVMPKIIKIVNNLIKSYNTMLKNNKEYITIDLDGNIQEDKANLKVFNKEELYHMIVSNCPCGLEMEMGIITNYLQLKTIYLQRRHHKLKDWHVFCDWCETLPKFKEFCLKEKD